jgi:hypothetical protein
LRGYGWLAISLAACGGRSAEEAPTTPAAGMGATMNAAATGGRAAAGAASGVGGVQSTGATGGSGGRFGGSGGATAGTGGTAGGGTGGVDEGGAAGEVSVSGSGSGAGAPAGGRGGVAGASGAAGASAAAGRAGIPGLPELGPELTDVTELTPSSCSISAEVAPAADIGMVGVATFTTDFADADRAIIQFGKTEDYTLEAPVNWDATEHKTWLLGMPADTTVHYRVVVMHGTTACIGDDATYQTGAAPAGAPENLATQKGTSPAPVAPGFIIAEKLYFAYIVNVEGEVVWAHEFPIVPVRALMSWDGMYLYARDLGATLGATGGAIYRVAMDGSGETLLEVPGGHHHDLVAIPSGFAYIEKPEGHDCDSIFTADPDGSNSKELVDLDVVFKHFTYGEGTFTFDHCHVNAIRYYRDDDSYSVSDREKDAIAFVSGSGELLGSVGATPQSDTPNHAKADGADSKSDSLWRVQHGHDLYAPNKLVLWSNGIFHDGISHVLHYTLDGASAKLDWQYTDAGSCPTTSDAQHLRNGNFLITNSRADAHEIDADAELVQVFTGLSQGYSSHRSTLYGPPPGR